MRFFQWGKIAKLLPPAVKLQLRGLGPDREKEHRLVSDVAGRQFIEIGQMHRAVVADPAVPASCAVPLQPFFAEYASWGVRIRALSAVQGASPKSSIDLLQLNNASAITRTEKCTGPRAPALHAGSMQVPSLRLSPSNLSDQLSSLTDDFGLTVIIQATISSSPPPGGPPTALKLQYQGLPCPACGISDISCVDNTFSAPLNLSTHRVMELELWSDCDGSYGCAWGYLGVQLQASGGFRDFIVRLNFRRVTTYSLSLLSHCSCDA